MRFLENLKFLLKNSDLNNYTPKQEMVLFDVNKRLFFHKDNIAMIDFHFTDNIKELNNLETNNEYFNQNRNLITINKSELINSQMYSNLLYKIRYSDISIFEIITISFIISVLMYLILILFFVILKTEYKT